jgi:hypothetical protein
MNGMDSAYLKVYHRICICKPWKILNTHNTHNKYLIRATNKYEQSILK